jgi:F-type H+-transporting ATPase subunit gamma
MASLRDIRTRIGATKNTRQITNAMKMVSAAKLRRATEAAVSARPYQQMLGATLRRIAAASTDVEDALLQPRPEVSRILVIVIGTDRGLCGGFNGNLNRKTEAQLRQLKADGKHVSVLTYGRKPRDHFKLRGFDISNARSVTSAKFTDAVSELSAEVTTGFVDGTYDEVYLAYNQFKNAIQQIPVFPRILPIALDPAVDAGGTEYAYEPSGPEILSVLLPLYLRTLLLQAFLETEAGEHAARMSAMDNATRNASDLIKSLTLDYNRGRQAAITKELIEIVSGAEAL